MPKKGIIKQATELVAGVAKLSFLALGATFLFVALLLLGNLALYTTAQITRTLFDLIRFIFKGS